MASTGRNSTSKGGKTRKTAAQAPAQKQAPALTIEVGRPAAQEPRKGGAGQIKARIEELRAREAALREQADKEWKAYSTIKQDWMLDHGYCLACKARGCRRYRPTLDFMNEYETVDCEACNATGRVEGLKADGTPAERRKPSPYGDYRNGSQFDPKELAPAYQECQEGFPTHAALSEIGRELGEVQRELKELEEGQKNPRGKRVRVVKYSNAKDAPPPGTEGLCFWCGESRYSGNSRVGFKDAQGKTWWTSTLFVEVG
jgi:hypothetical protein